MGAWAPANKAVEIIAPLTGNLEPAKREEMDRITTVIYHLAGIDGDETSIVDAEGYTVLPYRDERADNEGFGVNTDETTESGPPHLRLGTRQRPRNHH